MALIEVLLHTSSQLESGLSRFVFVRLSYNNIRIIERMDIIKNLMIESPTSGGVPNI